VDAIVVFDVVDMASLLDGVLELARLVDVMVESVVCPPVSVCSMIAGGELRMNQGGCEDALRDEVQRNIQSLDDCDGVRCVDVCLLMVNNSETISSLLYSLLDHGRSITVNMGSTVISSITKLSWRTALMHRWRFLVPSPFLSADRPAAPVRT
jgi:hypothetical protein